MTTLIAKYLSKTPFLRYLIFFATGILLYFTAIDWQLILGVSVFFVGIIAILSRTSKFYRVTLLLLIGHLLLLITAYFSCYLKNPEMDSNFILHQRPSQYYKVVTTDQLGPNRFYGKIIGIYHNGQALMSTGDILLNLSKVDVKLFDTLQIRGCPSMVKGPNNPEEFDYKQYLQNRGILLQDFINKTNVVYHGRYHGFSIKILCNQFREYFTRRIKTFIPDPDISAIALALILGIKNELSDGLQNAYIDTGTIHILAVSGMHVGLLFASIVWVCAKLFGKNHTLAYSIFAILVMWLFAMVTGFSASVVRAAVMYSVFQIGLAKGKRGNLPNTLFSSCFIILVMDPMMLLDVGFQLSFFAVLGIVCIQPIFQNIFQTERKVFINIRDLFTVSISAQIGVLPISLYYFKQFPNLFIISNLFEVTLSTIALYIGMLGIILIGIDGIFSFLCKILSLLIGLMNDIATYLSGLSYSVSKVYINSVEAIFLGLIILCTVVFFRSKNLMFLKFNLVWVLFFILSIGTRYFLISRSEKIIFYAHRHGSVIDVYENGGLNRIYCTNDSISDAYFKTVLNINRLKYSFSDNYKTISLAFCGMASFENRKQMIQIINSQSNVVKPGASIIFLNKTNYSGKLPKSTFFIVNTKKQLKHLIKQGYSRIHCLETQGAFEI